MLFIALLFGLCCLCYCSCLNLGAYWFNSVDYSFRFFMCYLGCLIIMFVLCFDCVIVIMAIVVGLFCCLLFVLICGGLLLTFFVGWCV